jgi:hypothetical protein
MQKRWPHNHLPVAAAPPAAAAAQETGRLPPAANPAVAEYSRCNVVTLALLLKPLLLLLLCWCVVRFA